MFSQAEDDNDIAVMEPHGAVRKDAGDNAPAGGDSCKRCQFGIMEKVRGKLLLRCVSCRQALAVFDHPVRRSHVGVLAAFGGPAAHEAPRVARHAQRREPGVEA